LRKIIKEDKCRLDNYDSFYYSNGNGAKERILKTFDKSIIALRIAMSKLAMIIENIEDNWVLYEILMQHKNMLHAQIDLLIKEKKKCHNRNHFLNT
jgi:ParB family chromosome partitioning protein